MKFLSHRISSRKRAQSAVEFALILPLLLVIILGIMELGRFLFIYIATTSASREGARYGSAGGLTAGGTPHHLDCTGIRNAALNLGVLAGITNADVIIRYDDGNGVEWSNVCPPAIDPPERYRIVVEVTGRYAPIVPASFLGMQSSYDIHSVTGRTIVKDIAVGTSISPWTRTPTQPPTHTYTPVPPPTETFTPAPPTATFTFTPSPTITPSPTNSPTVTLTPTGATKTPTATATATPTITPSPTLPITMTPTITPTPTPYCFTYDTIRDLEGSKFTWRLHNGGTINLAISSIYVEFLSNSSRLDTIQFGNPMLWDGNLLSPATAQQPWVGGADPSFPYSNYKDMIINFTNTVTRITMIRLSFLNHVCPDYSVSNINP